MIFITDLAEQLRNGEGSQLNIVDLITKRLSGEGINKILLYTNACLEDLSIRFNLGEEQSVLDIVEGVSRYKIDGALEITEVTNLHGVPYPFNSSNANTQLANFLNRDALDLRSSAIKPFISPRWGELIVPPTFDEDQVLVRYKASSQRFKLLELDEDTGEPKEPYDHLYIDLPSIFTTAIVYYVAMRLQSPRGTERAGQQVYNESSSFYAKYTSECEFITAQLNNNSTTPDSSTAFDLNRFP